jgi:hypothetical protein
VWWWYTSAEYRGWVASWLGGWLGLSFRWGLPPDSLSAFLSAPPALLLSSFPSSSRPACLPSPALPCLPLQVEGDEEVAAVSTEEQRAAFLEQLAVVEDWLYGEGEEAEAAEYRWSLRAAAVLHVSLVLLLLLLAAGFRLPDGPQCFSCHETGARHHCCRRCSRPCPAPPVPGLLCRARLRTLREVGDRVFERAAEAAARPQVLKLADGFVELVRKAANSWPDMKPWLNASDVAALVAKVVGHPAAARLPCLSLLWLRLPGVAPPHVPVPACLWAAGSGHTLCMGGPYCGVHILCLWTLDSQPVCAVSLLRPLSLHRH